MREGFSILTNTTAVRVGDRDIKASQKGGIATKLYSQNQQLPYKYLLCIWFLVAPPRI